MTRQRRVDLGVCFLPELIWILSLSCLGARSLKAGCGRNEALDQLALKTRISSDAAT